MKKILLLMMLCWPMMLAAQNGVKVEGLEINAGTVTFTVSWDRDNPIMPALWSDSVWVFVDYNKNGVMERLLVTGANASAGTVTKISGNDKGVWIAGDARTNGSFSAKVELFTEIKDVGGACVYGSNYPPVGKYTSPTQISFTGTAPYTVVLEDSGGGTTTQEPNNSSFMFSSDYTVKSFTDKTGTPGIIHCLQPASPTVVDATFCFGLPGQLQAAASGNATIVWYDAPTAGNLLYGGNVLPLTPLYNDAAQYYAEAVSEKNCPSTRTAANYTVNHCVIDGYCPGFAAGNVGSGSAPEAACSAYDSGRIGLVNYQATCEVFYPGQIGSAAYPAACMSYDAGWIGKQN